MEHPDYRVPSCGWYYAKYDATYWGGAPFNNLMLMRDDDDKGIPVFLLIQTCHWLILRRTDSLIRTSRYLTT